MNESIVCVLVVDDSAVVRGLLARALETDPKIEVSGTADNGQSALSWMRKHPVDVVVLDVEMPVMDGMQTLLHVQQEFPDVRVVMASALTFEGAEITVRALSEGAAGCIAKPQASSMHESIQMLVRELVPLVKALGPRQSSKCYTEIPAAVRSLSQIPVRPKILVIGSSTGGPNALRELLTGLPQDFPLPILIVQHMPPMFTSMLAKHLEQDTARPGHEAVHGETIEAGTTYVAPGDHHLTLVRQDEDSVVAKLNQDPQEHFCRPSVNPLFRTAADCFVSSVLAVVLTGMGEDGLEGSQTIVERGGHLIAQDEATSVVWGMPGAVVRANLANEVLPLPEIAQAIQRLCLHEVMQP